MKKMAKIIFPVIAVLFMAMPVAAQTADEITQLKLQDLNRLKDNGYFKGYLSPMISTVGSGLLTGLWKSADMAGTRFRYYVGIDAQNVWIPNDLLKFSTPSSYSATGNVNTPTLFGGKPAVVQNASNLVDASFLPGLLPSEGGFLPTGSLHLTLGSLYGTAMTTRFLYIPDVFKLGDKLKQSTGSSLWLLSLGLAHSVTQYFKDLPFDGAVSFSYGHGSLLDLVFVNAYAVDLNLSRKLAIFEFLGGIGWGMSQGSVDFRVTPDMLNDNRLASDFEFRVKENNVDGLSSVHGNFGLSIQAGRFSTSGVFMLAKQMSAGISLGFGM